MTQPHIWHLRITFDILHLLFKFDFYFLHWYSTSLIFLLHFLHFTLMFYILQFPILSFYTNILHFILTFYNLHWHFTFYTDILHFKTTFYISHLQYTFYILHFTFKFHILYFTFYILHFIFNILHFLFYILHDINDIDTIPNNLHWWILRLSKQSDSLT